MYVTQIPVTMLSGFAPPQRQSARSLWFAGWSRRHMRLWSYGAFLCMSLLSASFFPFAKPVLDRMNSSIFVAIQMAWLVPPALLLWSRRHITRIVILRGMALGSCMGVGLLCLTLAMAFTSITETALFSCMNGILVVLVSWLVFRQRVQRLTWCACLFSIAGILLLLSISEMHWQGDLLAFFGGLLLTGYSFLVEKCCLPSPDRHPLSRRAVLGIECLTMAGEMLLYALLFGNWQSLQFVYPSDLFTFTYISLVTTFAPMVTMIVMRHYVNGVTLTFLSTIEPIAGAIVAFFFVHERFPPLAYLGAAFAVGSTLLQALASRVDRSSLPTPRTVSPQAPFHTLHTQTRGQFHLRRPFPMGRRAHLVLTSLWSTPHGADFVTLQHATGIPCGCLHRLLSSLQKRGYIMRSRNSPKPSRYKLHPTYIGKQPKNPRRSRKASTWRLLLSNRGSIKVPVTRPKGAYGKST
ncbi:DMT family transporter [Ktedonospora formicarum]|uniref:DMT family transporter n=1 Tax=Ktedonospora formicarum TaxID=2778364 RepID=UPI001C68D7C5|nr:EamA family transporter [Ktedonospora formicarum]